MSPWKRRDESLDAELRDYLERETKRNVDAGMAPDEARHAARRKLGSMARVKEDTRAASAWRGSIWIEQAWHDLRHGARMLRKNPGFTAIAVLSLAIGVGANTATFSVADVMLLRPLPVLRPSEVLNVGSINRIDAVGASGLHVSYPDYRDLRDRGQSFAALTAFTLERIRFARQSGASPEVRLGLLVTGNFFRVLGVEPELGRSFRAEEDQVPGRDAVVVLSHVFWRQQFGADPSVLGRRVDLNGLEFTVIGVAPERFTGVDQFVRPAFYVPMKMWPAFLGDGKPNPLERRDLRVLTAKGRLRAGVSIEQANDEVASLAAALETQYPDSNENQTMAVRTELRNRMESAPANRTLVIMLAMLAAVVLLVACANVAGLLSSRAPARAREIALRLSIGAGRGRLIRQLLTENLLLALVGGLAGLGVGYAGVQLWRQMAYSDPSIVLPFELNQRALVFSFAVAALSVFLFGLLPAVQTARANLVGALKSAGEAAGRRRLWGRSVLVTSQVAMSLALLSVAAFMFISFRRQLASGPGFRTDHMLVMTIDPTLAQYGDAETQRFFEQLVERSQSLPGVESAAVTSIVPMSGNANPLAILPDSPEFQGDADPVSILTSAVSEGFFEAMAIPVLQGRAFRASDRSDAPRVAIVNDKLASHYWAGSDPVGRRFRLGGHDGPLVEIIGVAKTTKYFFTPEPPLDYLYLPYAQNPTPVMAVMVHTAGDSLTLAEPLRGLVRNMDASLPILELRSMEDIYEERAVNVIRIIIESVGGMGLMGVALAFVGLYGLVAYSVSSRTREIGIRMAIGASRGAVMRMVLRKGMALAGVGLAIGLILTFGADRALRATFPGGSGGQRGVLDYLAAIAGLLAVTALASYIPARRAARIEPTKALRYE